MGNQTQFYNVLACAGNRTLISNSSILSFGSNEEWKFGFSNFFFFFGYTVLDQVLVRDMKISMKYNVIIKEKLILGCLARINSLKAKISSNWIYRWWS